MNHSANYLLLFALSMVALGCGKPAPKYDVSTPEAAVETMLVGIAESNINKIEAAATPHEKLNSLANKILNGEELKEELARLESQKITSLKAGEEYTNADGETVTVDDSMVGGNRQQLLKDGYPEPFVVVKADGKWQVDTEAFLNSPNKDIGHSGLPPIGPPGGGRQRPSQDDDDSETDAAQESAPAEGTEEQGAAETEGDKATEENAEANAKDEADDGKANEKESEQVAPEKPEASEKPEAAEKPKSEEEAAAAEKKEDGKSSESGAEGDS